MDAGEKFLLSGNLDGIAAVQNTLAGSNQYAMPAGLAQLASQFVRGSSSQPHAPAAIGLSTAPEGAQKLYGGSMLEEAPAAPEPTAPEMPVAEEETAAGSRSGSGEEVAEEEAQEAEEGPAEVVSGSGEEEEAQADEDQLPDGSPCEAGVAVGGGPCTLIRPLTMGVPPSVGYVQPPMPYSQTVQTQQTVTQPQGVTTKGSAAIPLSQGRTQFSLENMVLDDGGPLSRLNDQVASLEKELSRFGEDEGRWDEEVQHDLGVGIVKSARASKLGNQLEDVAAEVTN